VFRANLGVTFGGVLLVDDQAVLPWEIPVFDWHWHEPMPERVDLRDLEVMGGMTLKCLEHGRAFRFGCRNDDLELDVEFRALMQPMLTRHEPPFNHGTHVDQPGRVRGRMRLHGEEIAVDCIAMRDRSWGIRAPRRQPKLGYCHATAGPDSSFLTITIERRGHDGLVKGYLMREGRWAKLVSGQRKVERDAQGRPAELGTASSSQQAPDANRDLTEWPLSEAGMALSSSPGQLPTPGPLQIRTRRFPPSGSSVEAARGYGPQIRTVIRGRGSGC
jgi:hypothetical protein